MRMCEHEHETPVPAEVIKLEASYSWDDESNEHCTAVRVYSCRPCAETLYDGTEEFPGYTELPEMEDGA